MKIIRELFDHPVTYKVVQSDDDEWIAEFTVDEVPYDFQGYLDLHFAHKNGESSHDAVTEVMNRIRDYNYVIQPYEIEFGIDIQKKAGKKYGKGAQRYQKSDTGNAATVFSTVLQITKEFLNVIRPQIFYFASKEENRTRLYSLLYEHISQKFPEYEKLLKTWYPPEKETLFIFRRK